MAPRQPEHALNQPDGPDATRGERGLRPLLQGRPDAAALAD
jgi:hypothetical protein